METRFSEQHRRVWSALDRLAEARALSPSALAKRAGLDPTSFNPSKRIARDGRLRWPSMETLTKVADAAGVRLGDIVELMDPSATSSAGAGVERAVVGEALTLRDPDAAAADALEFRLGADAAPPPPFASLIGASAAVRVATERARPSYRPGDVLLVDEAQAVEPGWRCLLAALPSAGGSAEETVVHLGQVATADAQHVTLDAIGPGVARIDVARRRLAWIGRILWCSQ